MSDNALSLLRAIEWLPASSPLLSAALLDWLLEEDSMTKRFERHCRQVTVEPRREGFVTAEAIAAELPFLPQEPRYWLREVILFGDGAPWLVGRTVVPESTLTGPEMKLSQLGSCPLGRYLFSSSTLTRDFIDPGIVAAQWGRRSRLRLSGKPLLLTELFLPASPLYQSLSGEPRD
ncbi:chorismate lyase [Mixta tenebrionis]|uniref:Chorismate pyruvate-lyase n=1 Tax=Mixta tenebrionis TaxID=2562439 RepID=A0A506V636_9GAMM|nr:MULTISPECIES: chorismate lyase [Mixta]QHM77878.1 Chorismate pyruvate-lyase [Mixta theicola]TPW40800.1 chorismate lyase [Mixta tenebrionis]